jgi:hypothetical protein
MTVTDVNDSAGFYDPSRSPSKNPIRILRFRNDLQFVLCYVRPVLLSSYRPLWGTPGYLEARLRSTSRLQVCALWLVGTLAKCFGTPYDSLCSFQALLPAFWRVSSLGKCSRQGPLERSWVLFEDSLDVLF